MEKLGSVHKLTCCLAAPAAGTWTRLPDYDSIGSNRRTATAVDADAAAALASQRLEDSGWPPILTRAHTGRLLLKLHSGPANPQGVAGVEVSKAVCYALSSYVMLCSHGYHQQKSWGQGLLAASNYLAAVGVGYSPGAAGAS
jgi:hypothetical protein